MIRYILFDFDGTLVDSREAAVAIFNQLAEKHRFKKVTHEDIEVLRKLTILQRCRLLKLPVYKIPFIVMESRVLYTQYLQRIPLVEGIKGMLSELSKLPFTQAVLSSNSEANIRLILEENQIDAIKAVYHSSGLFGKDAVIKKFLKIHKLHPSEVIYVGDELRDIIACTKSGIRIIFVSWGYDSAEAVSEANPDFIVNTPEEIVSLMQSQV